MPLALVVVLERGGALLTFFLSPDSGWPIINVGTNERGNQRTQGVAIHYTWEGALGPASQTPQGGALWESLELCHA